MENAKHFVLVHGTCLGAWCWYKLVTLLRHAGHRVTALDLEGSGIHSNQIHEVTSIWPLMEFLGSIHEDEKPICLITLPFPESSYKIMAVYVRRPMEGTSPRSPSSFLVSLSQGRQSGQQQPTS
ncbi:methylesterase 10-like [Malus domestica]|uniref:methylesterase 10-like n=1 Tax=Malus domestica TaxID=3750 RepID=UPI0004986C41|nr:methylesterase 10-like [Malus domestica]